MCQHVAGRHRDGQPRRRAGYGTPIPEADDPQRHAHEKQPGIRTGQREYVVCPARRRPVAGHLLHPTEAANFSCYFGRRSEPGLPGPRG